MVTPSEMIVFKRNEDVQKFFYLFENIVIKDLPDTVKDEKIVAYLVGYLQWFALDIEHTPEAKNH